MKKYIVVLLLCLIPSMAFAVDHYASPTGTDTWANSVSSSTPCSIQTAFANAVAGDTVYLRGGTYTVTSPLTSPSAHDGSSGNPVVFENYPSETPHITGSNLDGTIMIESDYWSLVGLTVSMSNMPDADHAVVTFGDTYSATYGVVTGCTIYVSSEAGRDNLSALRLQGERANYATIYNNTITGNYTSTSQSAYGIQFLGVPGARGVKIYNNVISEGGGGIYFKHTNSNGAIEDGCEFYNNYLHTHRSIFTGSLGAGGIWGNPSYCNIHNNLFVNSSIDVGMNGGGLEGEYCTINHNTVYNRSLTLWSPSGDDHDNNTITNNIFSTSRALYGTTSTTNTFDYNMWGVNAAIGANDLGNTSAIYVSGSPTEIADFELSPASPGYLGGSDSYSIGVNDIDSIGLISESSAYHWVDDNGASAWGSCESTSPLSGTAACSLSTALANADDDDVVMMRGGTYNTSLRPANSGASGHPITFQAYNGESPVIKNVAYAINLSERHYVVIDGIDANGDAPRPNANITNFVYMGDRENTNGGSYNTIQNGNFIYAHGWACFQIRGDSHHNSILNNVMSYCGAYSNDSGDMISIQQADNNLVQGNTADYAGHNILDLDGHNNIIIDNNFKNEWERVVETRSLYGDGSRNLIANNRFYESHPATDNAYPPVLKLIGEYQIFRNNLIYTGISYGIQISPNTPNGYGEANGMRIFNNVLYHNGDWDGTPNPYVALALWKNDASDIITNNIYKNNAFVDNSSSSVEIRLNTDGDGLESNFIVNNNFYHNGTGGNVINYMDAGGANTVTWYETNRSGNVWDNIEVAPGFTDAANANFSLSPTSGMIDAGGWLTTASAGGTGTQIPVFDAGYFCDGFGMIEGDTIQIEGQLITAIVTNVNYSTNIITVDRSMTWDVNDGVSLAYNGTAPDIGAVEYTGAIVTSDPVVSITGPSINAEYNTNISTGTVSGIATDEGGTIASLSGVCTNCTPSTFTVTCDDGTCDEAEEEWTSETLTYAAGYNIATVTATDNSSDTGIDSITINYGQEEWIQAESGTESSPMVEAVDGSRTYIYSPTSGSGYTTLNFSVGAAGYYRFLARVYAPDSGSDSMYFEVDSEGQGIWHFNPEAAPSQYGSWYEDEISAQGTGTYSNPEFDPYTLYLSSGAHTITFTCREAYARIDYFYPVIAPNPQTNPETTITGPTTYDTISCMGPVTVSGIATDSGTITSGNWILDCAGTANDDSGALTPDDGTFDESSEAWHVDLPLLPEGDCTITIYTTDNDSNTSDVDVLTITSVRGARSGGSGSMR